MTLIRLGRLGPCLSRRRLCRADQGRLVWERDMVLEVLEVLGYL
jgi:hypothetical protein